MTSDTVQQIKDRVSITDVVSQYVKLERAGSTLRARCPFHAEKTPSFFVSPERGTFHCFGCGEGGDIFTFVQKIEGIDFKGALKILADKAGVEIVYGGNREEKDERDRLFELLEAAVIFYTSHLSDAAKKYLHDRGLADTTIQTFRIGLAGNDWSELSDFLKKKGFSEREIVDAGLAKKTERGSLVDKFRNRIMFPIGDSAGRVVGFSGRTFGEHASPDAPKYLNSPETAVFHKSRLLFGFDKAKQSMRKLGCAVLVEGQMDLLASHQAGWGNTVALSGTAFTPEHAQLIHRMTDNLILALDADEAGLKAAARSARAALQQGLNVKVAPLPNGLDPADLVLKEGPDAWKAAIRNAKEIIIFLLDALEERAKDADAFRRTVEAAVLPFLNDIRSPIAREKAVHEIADRLSVSEAAVLEALKAMPRVPGLEENRAAPHIQSPLKVRGDLSRAHGAFALLLWQRSLPQSVIDLPAFESQVQKAIGEQMFSTFVSLPEEEKEALRFSAERLYSDFSYLPREAGELINALTRERLSRELEELSLELRKAEKTGNEAEKERLTAAVDMLIKQIAQLHELR